MNVDRVKDFIERVTWTAIQAAAGAVIAAIALDSGWRESLTFVGVAALVAACKVIVAQRSGDSQDGAAIPGGTRK